MNYSAVRIEQDRIVVETEQVQWGELTLGGKNAASVPIPLDGNATGMLLVTVGSSGEIPEHAVEQAGLVFVMAGSGELRLPGREALAFRAPDVIRVGGDVMHSWAAGADGFTMAVCLLS